MSLVYFQNYDPLRNGVLSTVVAALPILVLLYLLALHPRRDALGRRQFGIYAPYAAAAAAAVAIVLAVTVMGMPAPTAISAFVYGALTGLLPIGWIVFAAIFLYNMTLVSGAFDVLRRSIAGITEDRRLQALLIAFSFGAFMEGAAGFGTPVAVAGAILAGLGFRPLVAAVIALIANTAPVAWGAIGTPIITLSAVSGLPEHLLTMMAGRQLPFFSILIPFWMIATLVVLDRGTVREFFEVWPATLVNGLSFALVQYGLSQAGNVMLVDIVSGVVSLAATALFLKIWHPKHVLTHEEVNRRFGWTGDPAPRGSDPARVESAATESRAHDRSSSAGLTPRAVLRAWAPWALLAVAVFLWGLPGVKAWLNGLSAPKWPMPYLHGIVYRTPPVAPGGEPQAEAAVYTLAWLSAAGTGILIAALISGLFVLRLTAAQWKEAFFRTVARMKVPIPVIATVVGLGFTTRYAGMDAILGLAFTKTGAIYPFFAAMLGWLGVFLTGSDTASNAMFGSLQRITAEQLGLNPVLIVASNSTGGVMGKMIDAQSIVVATVATYETQEEGLANVGTIFRHVFWHSVALATLMGLLVLLQAYVFPWMQVPYRP
ncbi:L-lactate permease [Hydrogenibacillus sp. N12]|uniref:L-lactate permease n=1 Tax=Hydrogenibacillus sp. N12 TaxID=2866627 RepID=UPI001C7DBB42|nr:L-lactate permease [Hydrogenibacillus sp. N12]QZA32580.1 L-lactate permease [Hydrogenibacillus sp. N12]